ncbi:MAG TPA: SCP2 sterol-binding domain-containing protein, partial [Solirubrobacterales bacterium]|nr:SCP2 sterol-binding domain-containing protein [Solirubrobacterales bacterium]
LAAALLPLISWGLRHALPETPGIHQFNATWCVLPFTQPADPLALAGIEATYEFRIRDSSALLRVHDGRAELLSPGAAAADATISMDPATVAAVGSGRRTISEAAADGEITVDGDHEAAAALFAAFESRPAGVRELSALLGDRGSPPVARGRPRDERPSPP